MVVNDPVTELHTGFSSPDATATPWERAVTHLEQAEIFWLSTVRPDGRPHVTPLIAAWLDGALYFSTGATERVPTRWVIAVFTQNVPDAETGNQVVAAVSKAVYDAWAN